jgi:multidrug resistance efflux pump
MHPRARIIAPILLLILLAGGGYWWSSQRASLASAAGNLSASGTIEAEDVLITSEVAGRVLSLQADEGQEVAQDAVLVQLDTALLQAQLEQARAAVAAADANLALVNAGARDEEVAQAQAAVAQAEASYHGAQRAYENAQQHLQDPQELDLQIAQAQAARDAAAASLRKLRAGSRAEDISAAEAQLAQAQAGLQSSRDRLSAAKTSAELAVSQAAQALTQAQARYAQAKYNWEYAHDTSKDPVVPNATTSSGQKTDNKLSDGQLEAYYAQFVQAEAALHAAEEQVRQAQVASDAARQAEVTGVQTGEQQIEASQAQLDKLRAGATREDIAIGQTALAGAQRTLDTLIAMRDDPQQLHAAADTAAAQQEAAQAALAQAQARLAQVQAGARPEQVRAAEAQLAQARAAQRQVEVQLAKATLKAPRAGLILNRAIHEGEQVLPGAPLMTLGSLDSVRLTLYIAEPQLGLVRQGQAVDVTVDSFPGRVFSGHVSFIASEAQFTPRNVQTQAERVTTVFAVRVELPNPDHALKPGMPADAVIGP